MGSVVKPFGQLLGIGNPQGDYYTPQNPNGQGGKYNDFANDYGGEMRAADNRVQDSNLTKGIYGEGGLQSKLASEGDQLANQGFNLTQGDQQAYGQASGDISRLFGQQDQAAAQALQRRGLGSASSGAAGAAYSGLAGNKNEMLAKAQTDIAQKRMADTQNRLMANRSLQSQLAATGYNMANTNYLNKGNSLAKSTDFENQRNAAMNAENRQAGMDKTGSQHKNLGDALSNSIYGVYSAGTMFNGGKGAEGDGGGGGSSASGAGLPISGGAGGAGSMGGSSGAGAGSTMFASEGGEVPVQHFDQGGSPMQSLMQLAPMALALLSKGGSVPPSSGPELSGEFLASKGMTVPGAAKVKGDSITNDTVPARLSPGEMVIPRSVMQSDDPAKNASNFVRDYMSKRNK